MRELCGRGRNEGVGWEQNSTRRAIEWISASGPTMGRTASSLRVKY